VRAALWDNNAKTRGFFGKPNGAHGVTRPTFSIPEHLSNSPAPGGGEIRIDFPF
jgi:hypothetical protein